MTKFINVDGVFLNTNYITMVRTYPDRSADIHHASGSVFNVKDYDPEGLLGTTDITSVVPCSNLLALYITPGDEFLQVPVKHLVITADGSIRPLPLVDPDGNASGADDIFIGFMEEHGA